MNSYSPETLISLVDALAADVQIADSAELTERRRLTQLWLSNPVVIELIDQGLESFGSEIQDHLELIAVGIAGLARTLHVRANQDIMPIAEADQVGKFRQVDQAMANINLAISTHYKVRTEELAPWTIHSDNPIDWPSEIAQDLGATYDKLGKPEQALEVLDLALHRANEKISQLETKGLPIIQAPTHLIDRKQLRTRNSYVGALSAKAVLTYRKARITKSIGLLTDALKLLNRAHTLHPNYDRLKTVAKNATKALFEKEYQGTLTERAHLGLTIGKSAAQLAKHRRHSR